jgi:serine protease AprX
MRRGVGLLAVGLVLGLLLATVPGQASQPVGPAAGVRQAPAAGDEIEVLVVLKDRADLAPAARESTRAARGQAVVAALRATAARSQRGLLAFLQARGVEHRPFYVVNAVWVRSRPDLVEELARRPEVETIAGNPHVSGVEAMPDPLAASAAAPAAVQENLLRLNADDAWALLMMGQGVVVAGQDTGVAWQHPALRDKYRGWDGAAGSHDFNWHDAIHTTDANNVCGANSPEPCDDFWSSHGTHTMGIMVGSEETIYVGMAPEAQWIACRNMDQGVGTPATYLECFEFFLAPYPVGGKPEQGDPARAPHVVNNSWGCPPGEGCDAAAIALLGESVNALRQAGIVVVASAGNSGSLGCGSVDDPPAIYDGSLTVGNFNHRDDRIADSSSRGPVIYGGRGIVKPDIAAPGTSILSSVKNGGYAPSSGTSMAAPHIAGAVALLLSGAPGLAGDVDAIEDILTRTAEPMPDDRCGAPGPPNNVWGWGIPDLWRAANTGLVRGHVVEAGSGQPVQGIRVVALSRLPLEAGDVTTTDAGGNYSLVLQAGVYDLSFDGTCHSGSTAVVEASDRIITTAPAVALPPTLCIYLPLAARQ